MNKYLIIALLALTACTKEEQEECFNSSVIDILVDHQYAQIWASNEDGRYIWTTKDLSIRIGDTVQHQPHTEFITVEVDSVHHYNYEVVRQRFTNGQTVILGKAGDEYTAFNNTCEL